MRHFLMAATAGPLKSCATRLSICLPHSSQRLPVLSRRFGSATMCSASFGAWKMLRSQSCSLHLRRGRERLFGTSVAVGCSSEGIRRRKYPDHFGSCTRLSHTRSCLIEQHRPWTVSVFEARICPFTSSLVPKHTPRCVSKSSLASSLS